MDERSLPVGFVSLSLVSVASRKRGREKEKEKRREESLNFKNYYFIPHMATAAGAGPC